MSTVTTDKGIQMAKWTQADEARFQEMASRRDKLVAAQREPVKVAVHQIILTMQRASGDPLDIRARDFRELLIEELIQRAPQIRDALEPFDDGERVADATPSAALVMQPEAA